MNVAAFIVALIGAGLNIFQPVITVPLPVLGLGASMFDIDGFLAQIILNGRVEWSGEIIFAFLIYLFISLVPFSAIWAGVYALQRKKIKIMFQSLECVPAFM